MMSAVLVNEPTATTATATTLIGKILNWARMLLSDTAAATMLFRAALGPDIRSWLVATTPRWHAPPLELLAWAVVVLSNG
jgi:hypothetical protein